MRNLYNTEKHSHPIPFHPMSPARDTMLDNLSKAFQKSAALNEALSDEATEWDKAMKSRLRKEVNALKAMMNDVVKFKGEVTADVIEGMNEVIRNTEAKLDGKPVSFKADRNEGSETNVNLAA